MAVGETPKMTPTEFIAAVNQTLDYSYASILIEGEVSSFKVNQGKWIFFDLKDEQSSINCFMPFWELRMPIEDGMKVLVQGTPKVTKWGKFSLTVKTVRPIGAGNLKKAYEILKKKLAGEGLFDLAKKRTLPENLTKLGVISSTQAAGYADFIKILNARWGGIKVQVAHTQVQGLDAPDQIIRALNYFNERGEVEVIAILRGGGSADDLAAFNDEKLVRAIAASKIPVITGVGHEVDESLADLAADVRASTPSNAAELLTNDKKVTLKAVKNVVSETGRDLLIKINHAKSENVEKVERVSEGLLFKYIQPIQASCHEKMQKCLERLLNEQAKCEEFVKQKLKILEVLNPEKVLSRGYAILSGKISPGELIKITTFEKEIKAKIKEVYGRKES